MAIGFNLETDNSSGFDEGYAAAKREYQAEIQSLKEENEKLKKKIEKLKNK